MNCTKCDDKGEIRTAGGDFVPCSACSPVEEKHEPKPFEVNPVFHSDSHANIKQVPAPSENKAIFAPQVKK